ncbi:hypothetical protein HU200_021697 [Digitaria exilis]|uniref:DUF1618 domain-containing protein n=1 Tax=Digitaria exilis TaxID=1010633 RepID=A0A835EZM3_9POAL|nr:hypothetical protein HU200_021697 [Digitaria exilis]
MAAASSSAGSRGNKAQRRDTPSCILMDMEGYIADCSNATTAWSKTSTGVPISASFCIARPPVLSHFFRCTPAARKLDLLPNPRPARFTDDEISVLSSGGGGYVVAALNVLPSPELHLYRFVAGTGCSTRRRRRSPNGGAKGTVGWVDLWRGILLRDVLSPEGPPKLRDIPLPLLARGNWEEFLNYPHPCFYRDVAVDDRRETIKYVEMEITLPEHVPVFPSRPEPASFVEWVNWQRQQEREQPLSHTLVPGSWTATTYSLPIPVGSWEDWRRESVVRSAGLKLPGEDDRHYELTQKLISRNNGGNKEETTLSLGCLNMAYPTIVADGEDTVYLMSKGTYRGSEKRERKKKGNDNGAHVYEG